MHKNASENVVFIVTIGNASENKKCTPLKMKNVVVKEEEASRLKSTPIGAAPPEVERSHG